MTKQPNLIDPVLTRILEGYGVQIKTARHKRAEECQDGVNSELANEDSGTDVSEDSLFESQKKMYKEEGSTEGGHYISDGKIDLPSTPDGEQPSFDNYMSGDEGGTETKKTNTDPGYRDATVSSELSISGSTVDKGAAFMKLAKEFVPAHEQFLEKLAAVAYALKLANPGMDPAMMGGDPAMGGAPPADPAMMGGTDPSGGGMDPMGAMAGMAGPGQGDPAAEEGGEGELSPEDAAIVEALIETQTGENPLTDEELSQIGMILEGAEARGQGGEEMPPMDPAMDPATAGGADPAMGMDPAMAGKVGWAKQSTGQNQLDYFRNQIAPQPQAQPAAAAPSPYRGGVAGQWLRGVGQVGRGMGQGFSGLGNVLQGNFRQGFGQMGRGYANSVGGAAKTMLSPLGGTVDNLRAAGRSIGGHLSDGYKGAGLKQADECLDSGCDVPGDDITDILASLDDDQLAALLAEAGVDADNVDVADDLGEPDLNESEVASLANIAEGDESAGAEADENAAIAEILDSMDAEELAALAEEVEAAQAAEELGVEPELDAGEVDALNTISSDNDAVAELKEAVYHGMTVDELRVAKDANYKEQLIREKQARLQAKNAGQARKAQRYGQLIDSLIRK